MKPFNLEEALSGEPVKLRSGRKAYIKYNLKTEEVQCSNYSQLQGYVLKEDNTLAYACGWDEEGKYHDFNSEDDIVGMWEEPRPTVTLTLPCPLKEPREDMYRLSDNIIIKSSYKIEKPEGTYSKRAMNNGLYFATESDAQAWLDALKNSRR